jgi:small subunit ribosomal protein S8
MAMSDPLGDMLTRIRNGLQAGLQTVNCPASNSKTRLLDALADEGYIRGYKIVELENNKKNAVIELKYFDGQPVIQHISRVSKPGRRVYSGSQNIPVCRNGLGVTIVSTPKGVMSDAKASKENVGGEVLCQVY